MTKLLKLVLTLILSLIGTLLGQRFILTDTIIAKFGLLEEMSQASPAIPLAVLFLLCVVIAYTLLAPIIINAIIHQLVKLESKTGQMSFQETIFSVIGIILGLIVANLISIPFYQFGVVGALFVLFLNTICGYTGYKLSMQKNKDIKIFEECEQLNTAKPKILDTSVIIDGRILDILKTGFIEGKIIIPQFVLAELRHVADSSDTLKRNRGRRGLDILNEIQKQLKVPVVIVENDYKNIQEVDSKLLKLAEEMNATIVTNDFNLNKVADFQGVVVLNINELSNAVKPVVLPGEDMSVMVIKDGKEEEQGIGYLNDGTMIVVEGGRRAIGQTIDVLVTSVLQTAAGRMIFTKIK